MEILRLLDEISEIETYEIQDYRHDNGGFYYRLKIQFIDNSTLFVREYVDETERNYAFHWQNEHNKMIMRWDNVPHHAHLFTFPHHKHTPDGIFESGAMKLSDVLTEIRNLIKPKATNG